MTMVSNLTGLVMVEHARSDADSECLKKNGAWWWWRGNERSHVVYGALE